MRPRISVVMPHYNQSHLVTNAINSIRNQTIEDWELVIIDDGSEKQHIQTLYELIAKLNDNRVKLAVQNHTGLVMARNNGCSIASSEIIATQDADDLSLPDRLEKALLMLNSDDVLYHGAYTNFWDAQLNCIARGYIPAEPVDKERIVKAQYIPGWPVFRKSVWEKRPFRIETQFMYDYAMWIDWIFSGFKVVNLDIGLYEYVRHENSASITFEKDGRRRQSHNALREIARSEYGIEVL